MDKRKLCFGGVAKTLVVVVLFLFSSFLKNDAREKIFWLRRNPAEPIGNGSVFHASVRETLWTWLIGNRQLCTTALDRGS